VKQRSGIYPRLSVYTAGARIISQAGGVLLVETIRASSPLASRGQLSWMSARRGANVDENDVCIAARGWSR